MLYNGNFKNHLCLAFSINSILYYTLNAKQLVHNLSSKFVITEVSTHTIQDYYSLATDISFTSFVPILLDTD